MNIAVTAHGNTLESPVTERFDETENLLIINVDTMDIIEYKSESGCMSATEMAGLVLKHRCEAVITGALKADAFKILADEQITRYLGTGLTVREALAGMDSNLLILICNPEGEEDGCSGSHQSGECSGHHHHDDELEDLNTAIKYVQ